MSNPPQLPPNPDDRAHFNVDGTGHTFIFGGNVKSQSTSSSVVQSFFAKQMASHGAGYWLIHLGVALAAAAIFELAVWHFHWLGH
jgi:hypothetical protein